MTTGAQLLAAQRAIAALERTGRISVLNWMFVCDDELPDDEVRVFVAIEDRDGPVEAFHQDSDWVDDYDGEILTGVYAWAHIPALPPVPAPVVLDEERPRLAGVITCTPCRELRHDDQAVSFTEMTRRASR